MTVRRFLSRSMISVAALSFARGAMRAVPYFCGGVLLLAGFDRWIEMSAAASVFLSMAIIAGGVGVVVSGFAPFDNFRLRNRSRALAERVPALRRDDLFVARQFLHAPVSDGVSEELKDEFLKSVEKKLASCSPRWCFPRRPWKTLAIGAAASAFIVAAVGAFYPEAVKGGFERLIPLGASLDQIVRVEPGDARVPRGADVSVAVSLLDKSVSPPVLLIKSGGAWMEVPLDVLSSTRYAATIRNVVAPISYRVRWRGMIGRRYTILAVDPVGVASFKITLTPPAYTQLPATVQEAPEMKGLAGTRVDLEAEATEKLSNAVLRIGGGPALSPLTLTGKRMSFRFALQTSATYQFLLTPERAEQANMTAAYPIQVVPDAPPAITLLSPDQDIVIGDKEKLPLTYDARDDVGLGDVFLEWESADGAKGRFFVRSFSENTQSTLSSYDWDLLPQRFYPGQTIRFRLEATDRNTVTGPGKSVSAWRLIEIRSFEKEHAVMEQSLEAWRDQAVEALAQMTTLKNKVDQNANMDALSPDMGKVSQSMKDLEENLKRIVSRMEQDPLADYGVWMEHQAMQENLALMNRSTLANTQAAFQTQNKTAASQNLDQMSNELERMTALSEQLSKAQNARDVTQAGENLENIGENLVEALKGGKANPEALSKIKSLIEEAQKNIAEMAQALQQMPQELPEDFVNQEALKNLELGKSQDILSQISAAMKNGDMEKAMALAQSFLKAAKAMREQVSKAHESFLSSNSAEELEKSIDKEAKELDDILDQQRGLLAQTQPLASKRLEAMMRAQENLLLELAERQKKITAQARASNALPQQLAAMENVEREFRAKRVDQAPVLLAGVIEQVAAIQSDLERVNAAAALKEQVAKIRQDEADILTYLKNPPPLPDSSTPDEKNKYADLEKRQSDVRKKTVELKDRLQLLSRKTASLSGALPQNLGEAGTRMGAAGKELGGRNAPSAQRAQEEAIDYLSEAQQALSQAKQAMGDMAMEQGGGSPSGQKGSGGGQGGAKVILRSGGGNGQGSRVGKVRLPNADDYRPPRAFREDLMESLKENYPKVYEEIIHKYYKRLAE